MHPLNNLNFKCTPDGVKENFHLSSGASTPIHRSRRRERRGFVVVSNGVGHGSSVVGFVREDGRGVEGKDVEVKVEGEGGGGKSEGVDGVMGEKEDGDGICGGRQTTRGVVIEDMALGDGGLCSNLVDM